MHRQAQTSDTTGDKLFSSVNDAGEKLLLKSPAYISLPTPKN
jgi:hypothetical protein